MKPGKPLRYHVARQFALDTKQHPKAQLSRRAFRTALDILFAPVVNRCALTILPVRDQGLHLLRTSQLHTTP